ncbi:GGDEF domain-containing protein [Pseudodesulfovibrio senegalensis]|jgi:diguanylate cyclase (GGDEF)-like protein/PAS domain S-box-containing protein|nr:GGDEF domain-containing protein [Pseudodesulfovibrio senegalensis]
MDMEFYKDVLESLTDGVYFVDRDRVVTFWNKGAERISGYSAQEIVGKSCADNYLRHVDDDGNELCLQGCPLAATMDDGQSREANVYMHHKFGHRIPVFVRSSAMRDEKGEVIGAVEVFADNSRNVSILKEMEELRKEVLTDQLTGVGNRRYADIILERLDNAMRDHGVPYGALFVDIDFFKTVNDSWGHHVGDRVLNMVAQTLSGALRPLDSVCRWGGEEFVVLISNVEDPGLGTLAERLRMLVERSWVDHEDGTIRVTASFGGAVAGQGDTPEGVIARADGQLYLSKDSGRNCVHINHKKTSAGLPAKAGRREEQG